MLHILQIWFVNFLQLAVFNSMKRCKSHHKGFHERIVGYLVSPAAWPSVLGWHTFGTIISIQNGTKHDPDLFETRTKPFRNKALSGRNCWTLCIHTSGHAQNR